MSRCDLSLFTLTPAVSSATVFCPRFAGSSPTHPAPMLLQISKAVSALVSQRLRVPPDRFYLKFTNVALNDMSWSGTSFAE